MLPFYPSQFVIDYPQFSKYSANELTNNYYNQALTLGAKILGLFANSNTPTLTWNASTNTPTLANRISGLAHLCTVGGTVNFGAGNITFVPNNIVSYDDLYGVWSNIGYPKQYYWSCQILAHIMQLLTTKQVGRVFSAKEGTVNGHFSFDDSKNGAWWNQTTYGAMCWQLIKQRTGFTYFPQSSYNGYPISNSVNIYGVIR